ncbi:unnamed protein product [Amaranthus hypochondriacus]
MWATTSQTFLPNPIPITHSISFSKLLLPPTTPHSAVRSRRISVNAAGTNQKVSGLGLAVLGAIKSDPSNPNSNPAHQQDEKPNTGRRKEEVDTGKEVSGSDILRALQRANAKKLSIKKQQQQRVKNIGSGNMKKENVGKKKVVDYDKIRPITVKSDWVTRLDDLEKRLQEFMTL